MGCPPCQPKRRALDIRRAQVERFRLAENRNPAARNHPGSEVRLIRLTKFMDSR
jgi:hypothetical protein